MKKAKTRALLVSALAALLIFAAIFSAIISYIRHESYFDSIVIIVIVVINAILSFIQEKKADAAISELNKMFVTNSYVIRNGKKEKIQYIIDEMIYHKFFPALELYCGNVSIMVQ